MQPNHSTAKAHMEIAHDINHAKRVMFEAHRKGKPLADAAEDFFTYLRNEFSKTVPGLKAAEQKPITPPLPISDDQISKLVGKISQKANEYLQQFAENLRTGAVPYDAWLRCSADFAALVLDYIPQERYRNLTYRNFLDSISEKAKAIILNMGGLFDAETCSVIETVLNGYSNDRRGLFTLELLTDLVERVESGDKLTQDDLPKAEGDEALEAAEGNDEDETPPRPREDLRTDEVEHLVATILASGDQGTPRPYALLLLLDEIENGESGLALMIAKRAVMGNEIIADVMVDLLIEGFRPEYAHSTDRTWTIKQAVKFYENDLVRRGLRT